ncbi:hypothetical protein [Larkinella arboricola]|uniref:Uncharacterized protein n=1 Tax=Larkinella arboricola TaxID=643671 RepID=A0A327X1M1_LARAB|nr:hypothetical protein [Larkinella arboricola]RAK00268.1 hypothetical protein LX87_01968 [Larkinella arboricola]
MRTLEDLTFQEIKQMREYALDLAAGYAKDAKEQAHAEHQQEAHKAVALEEEWIHYAKALDEELQNRIKRTIQKTNPVF